MTLPLRDRRTFPVAGLHGHEWTGVGPTVLCLAGIGSSGIVWSELADALPEHRVLSLDLRGRGRSSRVGGEHGMRAHARDVAQVIGELDLDDVVLVGHSMGAYLAPVVAQEARGRVSRLVLVDGGVPAKLPFFMRPALTRLSWSIQGKRNVGPYENPRACVDKVFRKALGTHGEQYLDLCEQWMAYELEQTPDGWRVPSALPHLVDDAVDVFHGKDVPTALRALSVPAHLVAAQWLAGDGGKPFLSDDRCQLWAGQAPLTWERVQGTNHVTVVFSEQVKQAVRGH